MLYLKTMTTERKTNEVNQVREWQARIIKSVLQTGLKSGATLHELQPEGFLGSNDQLRPDYIDGCTFRSAHTYNSRSKFLAHLRTELYRGPYSLFPVLVERRGRPITTANIRKVVPPRAASSFIVICDKTQLLDPSSRFPYEVAPSLFSHIIFPANVWQEDYRQLIPAELRLEILIASGLIKRKIGFRDFFNVPNYEEIVRQILETTTTLTWLHGVRLPATEDLSPLKLG